MKLPFIELTPIGGGKMYVNRLHIQYIFREYNRCFVQLSFRPDSFEIQEPYDEVKTRLYE